MFGKVATIISSAVSGIVSALVTKLQAWWTQNKLQQEESKVAALKAHRENELTREQIQEKLLIIAEEWRKPPSKNTDDMLAHLRNTTDKDSQ